TSEADTTYGTACNITPDVHWSHCTGAGRETSDTAGFAGHLASGGTVGGRALAGHARAGARAGPHPAGKHRIHAARFRQLSLLTLAGRARRMGDPVRSRLSRRGR